MGIKLPGGGQAASDNLVLLRLYADKRLEPLSPRICLLLLAHNQRANVSCGSPSAVSHVGENDEVDVLVKETSHAGADARVVALLLATNNMPIRLDIEPHSWDRRALSSLIDPGSGCAV